MLARGERPGGTGPRRRQAGWDEDARGVLVGASGRRAGAWKGTPKEPRGAEGSSGARPGTRGRRGRRGGEGRPLPSSPPPRRRAFREPAGAGRGSGRPVRSPQAAPAPRPGVRVRPPTHPPWQRRGLPCCCCYCSCCRRRLRGVSLDWGLQRGGACPALERGTDSFPSTSPDRQPLPPGAPGSPSWTWLCPDTLAGEGVARLYFCKALGPPRSQRCLPGVPTP